MKMKMLQKNVSALLASIYLLFTVSFCLIPEAKAQTVLPPKISLFAKVQDGDYYTLTGDGVKKEDSYIGGLKSVQLDPLEENIYFYDTVLKVIAKINLKDEKVYKVIGKPKNTLTVDYTNPVKFSDAGLGKLLDFTFDKYGNIFILDSTPKILKASIKDGTIKEVFNIPDGFPPFWSGAVFNLKGISYDNDRYFYVYGDVTPSGQTNTSFILKFDPYVNISYVLGSSYGNFFSQLNLSNSSYFSVNGLSFDHSSNSCFVSSTDYANSSRRYDTAKLITKADGTYALDPYIGDGTGSLSDIGDGGQARSAYVVAGGSRFLCDDKNGDIFVADNSTQRVRKILKDSGYITTVVGGGKETLAFGEEKTPKAISLSYPNALCVDKTNNLYIAEPTRILLVKSLVVHYDKPLAQAKVANLSITKVAGADVKNPRGEINVPDLSLDYTYAGDKTIEVKAENIPEGTNVKLLGSGVDGAFSQISPSSAKLAGGIATVPIQIEAGTTKVIKAETDPFIPAPGVYLSGTEPKVQVDQLLPEPQISTPKRDAVNTPGNLLSPSQRLNFLSSWLRIDNFWAKSKLNATGDPDSVGADATYLDLESYAPTNYTALSSDVKNTSNKNVTFTVWMRTDSGTLNFPIGIAPASDSSALNAQYYASWIAGNYLQYTPLFSYSTVAVTPSWQKFTITSNPQIQSYNKQIILGGLAQNASQKVYIWGARLEAAQ